MFTIESSEILPLSLGTTKAIMGQPEHKCLQIDITFITFISKHKFLDEK